MSCLACNETVSKRGGRGLCQACYMTALRFVRNKEYSWRELESAGLARPLLRHYSARSKLFLERLKK